MTDSNFVVKNGIVVNTAFTANSTVVTLGSNLTVNTSSVFIGNSTANTVITGGSITLNGVAIGVNANNASYLGGVAAGSYQLNSTLAANVATLTANNSTNLGGVVASGYQTIAGLAANVATLTANNATNLGGVAASGYQTTAGLAANVATLTANNATYHGGQALSAFVMRANTTSTDLNLANSSGFYRVGNTEANRPAGNTWSFGQLLTIYGGSDTITQIYGNYADGQLATRSGNPTNVGGVGSWSAWRTIVDSANYNTYAPTLTGTGASGTWSISISGTANNALYLGGIAASGYQTALGFTPVQQGGGAGQNTNKLYLGWASGTLRLQVDTTDYAGTWPISITGNATTVANVTPGVTGKSVLAAANSETARATLGVQGKASLRNRHLNPAFQICQDRATGATVVMSVGGYAFDGIAPGARGGGALTCSQVAKATPGGSPYRFRASVTTVDASIAASDIYLVNFPIEGVDVADLMFGSASARSFVWRGVVNFPAGTYGLSFRNGAATRSYVTTFTVSAGEAGTDKLVTAVVPGDTSGTWINDASGIGINARITFAAGTTYQTATTGAWQAGDYMTTSAQTNTMATTSAVFEIADIGLYVGTEVPTWEMPSYADDLRKCMRYFQGGFGGSQNTTSRTVRLGGIWHVPFRAIPSVNMAVGSLDTIAAAYWSGVMVAGTGSIVIDFASARL